MEYYCKSFLNSFKKNTLITNVSSTEKIYNFLTEKIEGFLIHQIIKEGIELLKFNIRTKGTYVLKNEYFEKCFIIIYLENGNLEITYNNKNNLILKKEEVFFSYEYSKKPIYNIQLSESMKCEGVLILISEEYLNSFIDDQEINQCFFLLKSKNAFKDKRIPIFPKRLLYIFRFILFYNNYLGRKLLLLSKINEITGGITTVFIRNSLNMIKEKSTYEVVKEYIEENYNDPKILSKIQRNFYFNRSELNKEFREKTGFGIYEYLKNIKLEESYYLLISQKMKVNEVSEFLNYKSYGYFSKIFKDYFGVSPKKIQQTFKLKENIMKNLK